MSPEPDDRGGMGRRRFLGWTSAVGATAITAGLTRSGRSGAPTTSLPPIGESPSGDAGPPAGGACRRVGDVSHCHFAELPGVPRQVDRYEATGDPTALYNPALAERLRARGGRSIDLVVRTVGERRVVEMAAPADRTIHGWRPKEREIGRLAEFGEVGYAAEVASTTVSLRNVAPEAVPAIASLPFVLTVAWDPPVRVDDPPVAPDNGVPVGTLRGPDYFRLDSLPADVSIPRELRIGIVDRGFGAAGAFERAYADEIGVDGDLARDFTEEGAWRNDDDHGSNVANTCAFMLPDGHDDLFVPLKVVPAERTPSRTDVRDNLRAAIEYAEIHGIDVLNLSLGTTVTRGTCPSAYCPELYGYVDAGFLPFTSIGNRDADTVPFPGGEWCTISVGGIHGSCEGGYERYVGEDGYYGSNYGAVEYHDSIRGETYCHYCRHRSGRTGAFSPAVYGCMLFRTGANESLRGTSYASPQAAAVGAVGLASGLDGYDEGVAVFRGMDHHEVCPDEAAGAGQLLDAVAAYDAATQGRSETGEPILPV